MVVRGWGQVLFGKAHWTAPVAKDLMGKNIQFFIKRMIIIMQMTTYSIEFINTVFSQSAAVRETQGKLVQLVHLFCF